MSTIATYPIPLSLDGSELLAGWKDGMQVAIPPALFDPETAGAPGLSAYQIWRQAGNEGTEAAFLASLAGTPGRDGDPGTPGAPGAAGQSAYQVWLAAGNTGTPQQFFRAIANLSPDGSTVSWAALTQSLNAAGYLGTLDQTPPSAADNLAAFQIYQHGWPSSIGDSMYAYLKTLLGLTDAQLTGIYNTVP